MDWKLLYKHAAKMYKMRETKEGTLFSGGAPHRDAAMGEQTLFLMKIIERIQPKRILEIGTCAAHFCLLVKTIYKDIHLFTMDISDKSKKCVDYLNKNVDGHDVRFECGDSKKIVSGLKPNRFQMCWLDGDHSYKGCAADLHNCQEIRIPHICVDDYRLLDGVQDAVNEFVNTYNYNVISISGEVDNRGIVYLRRN